MTSAATITPAIVDALYEDALMLTEEARMVFEQGNVRQPTGAHADARRVALSCEALRTTTRMMHAMAWLLNHRAYFAGELTESQLRHYGRLPPPQADGDAAQVAMLDFNVRDVVERTRAVYARIERLDSTWRDQFSMQSETVHRLRDRLGQAFG